MKILLSGSTGLIGRALTRELIAQGHEVKVLVRRPPEQSSEVYWDPQKQQIDKEALNGTDAVIHLGGRSIACRWNTKVKEEIRSSRVGSTAFLVDTLNRLSAPPRTFICASAIGYYGDRGEEILSERSPPGTGFLAETCVAWEEAARRFTGHGRRVIHLRFGQVLSRDGGSLQQLLPLFKWGLGGPVGSGKMWWSWILHGDAIRAILYLLNHEALEGPFNIVSPHPVRNGEFARILARVLGRPAIFRTPSVILQLLFGEMAREVLLASTRVQPARLTEAGFTWEAPTLSEAIKRALSHSE